MPIKSWIEKDKKRVMAIVSGNFSIEEILIAINNTIEGPDDLRKGLIYYQTTLKSKQSSPRNRLK